jgi:ATP-binding cassette subfamily F protein uup
MVSHDREFLNRVVTSTIAVEGGGRILETVGGYQEYARRKAAEAAHQETNKKPVQEPAKPGKVRHNPKAGLTQKQRRELDALPQKIEALELELEALTSLMGQPDYGKPGGPDPQQVTEKLSSKQKTLDEALARWEVLEAQAS